MEDHDPPAVTAGGWALPCARGGALAARACALLPERVATPLRHLPHEHLARLLLLGYFALLHLRIEYLLPNC